MHIIFVSFLDGQYRRVLTIVSTMYVYENNNNIILIIKISHIW